MVRTSHRFTFGDRSSSDFECFISGSGTFDSSSREYDSYQIPGKSGDLHIDTGRYSNVPVVYPAFINRDFDNRYRDLRNYLLSCTGYRELWDDYHPDEYRLAVFKGGVSPDMGTINLSGSFDLEFDCKPQRYLVSGKVRKTFTEDGAVVNPEMFPAMPLIRIYGSGTVRIGAYQIDVSEHDQNYVDIDCELMDAFCGATNMNAYISVSNDAFPVLVPGTNGVQMSGVTKVEIVPRWWRL